jgi:hypothetical protein
VDSADPVQDQLEAYNAHDLEAFVACYAADAVIRHADGRVLMRGHDEIRQRYQRLFEQNPDVTAEVPTRIRAGDWVVDEEKVRLADRELHVAVGYEVRDGLIHAVVMLRSDL